MSDQKYLEGINTTGFGLEFDISSMLTSSSWTVINNKYYIDDVQGAAREIDILAYKATPKNGVQVYTVLIISCKKSKENAWALLSKELNVNDPNIDWSPVTLWSNEEVRKLIIENYEWKKTYIDSDAKLKSKLFHPKKHIFAFQELSQKKGTPQNDKAIFNSIVSSMKSQNYEMDSLNKRKKDKAIYNFNLLSVVDAPLLRVSYGHGQPSIQEIESDIYVGSYIINKEETISRVHFIKKESFNSLLDDYNNLHDHNIEQSTVIYESFYKDCLKEKKKVNLFISKFNRKLRWDIHKVINNYVHDEGSSVRDLGIWWDKQKNCAAVYIEGVFEDEALNALNSDEEIKKKISSSLKELYRYEGEFYFDSDIPF
jgi:hypothetical protein